MKVKLKTMQKIILLITVMVFAGLNNGLTSARLSGKQIAEKAKYQNRARTRVSWAVMKLQKKSGGKWQNIDVRKTIMQGYIYSGSGVNSLQKSLSRFTSGLKRGVTALSIEKPGKQDNVQYTYLPSLKRPRRVASSDKQNDFEDTDFTNEDMGTPNLWEYNYKRLPDQTYRGIPCYVIERTPKSSYISQKKYKKHKSWITKKHFIPIKVYAYDLSFRLKKKMYARQIRKHKNIYVPHKLTMINVQDKTRTIIYVRKVLVNAPVNKGDFYPSRMDKAWKWR